LARDRAARGGPRRQWPAGWGDSLVEWFELPRDAVRNLARLTLMGPWELLVENHRGILFFDAVRVVVGVPDGRLEITGRGLVIGRIDREALHLHGQIESLRFLPPAEGERL